MENSKRKDTLKSSLADHAHTLVKAGLSAIPVLGGPAAEIFSAIIVPPLSKRRDKWIEEIAEGLLQLKDKIAGYKIEDLSQNETFITVAMHATQSAIRNNQEEKLKALRNAVLNSAIPNELEDEIKLIFIHYIDSLTPWHIKVINIFHKPKNFRKILSLNDPSELSQLEVLEKIFVELKGKREFLNQILRDLTNRGLISDNRIYWGGPEGFTSPITDLGKQFLEFIVSPFES